MAFAAVHTISCGAALSSLRLALACFGEVAAADVVPDPARTSLRGYR